ncbi:YciI family protein [Erythrobacter sp. WG]|uniref:YciI family protein n=1 Tax=Erythrobacter sp. WG TaxID=2985510 RepID=UPI00226D9154|nr:YciI family protein [Erythrobacter sp. WG]MCX9147253.1 YciI family protein [Erythrobacter sp. WG]
MASIFIASLTYTVPIARIDAALEAHLAWLKAGHEAGHFVAWGPREPRDGGLIFIKAASREEAERLLAADPFMQEGLADLQIIQWTPRFDFPGLEAFHG